MSPYNDLSGISRVSFSKMYQQTLRVGNADAEKKLIEHFRATGAQTKKNDHNGNLSIGSINENNSTTNIKISTPHEITLTFYAPHTHKNIRKTM